MTICLDVVCLQRKDTRPRPYLAPEQSAIWPSSLFIICRGSWETRTMQHNRASHLEAYRLPKCIGSVCHGRHCYKTKDRAHDRSELNQVSLIRQLLWRPRGRRLKRTKQLESVLSQKYLPPLNLLHGSVHDHPRLRGGFLDQGLTQWLEATHNMTRQVS